MARQYKTVLQKAVICGKLSPELIEQVAGYGANGIETRPLGTTIEEARKFRNIAEANGLRIHSMMQGGRFNDPDESVREKSLEEVKNALRLMAAFGGDNLLVVPARIPAIGPKPWEFKIEFDPATCMVKKVVEGDNAPYADYIREQNKATELVLRYVNELVPVAAKEGVTICLENVWNNLWVKPELVRALIGMFDNRWVKSYLDLGNHVKYAPTEQWIRTLGPSIVTKMHIKDFTIDKTTQNGGKFVPPGQGDINWPSVRDTIEEMGINGWITFEPEGGRFYTTQEEVEIMRLFLAGNLTRETANKVRKYTAS